MSMSKDYFGEFKVEKPEFSLLPEGDSRVRVIRAEILNSFQKFNGSPKDELPQWKNATPQLAITVVASEKGKNGGLTHRFNGCGYEKYDELSQKQMESGDFENIDGYACKKDKDGDIVRIVSKERTESCNNIINQFAAAMQLPVDSNLMDGVNRAIAEKTEVNVTVVNKPFDGRDQLRLEKFRAAAAVTVDDGFED